MKARQTTQGQDHRTVAIAVADDLLVALKSGKITKIGIDEVRSGMVVHQVPLTLQLEELTLRILIEKVR